MEKKDEKEVTGEICCVCGKSLNNGEIDKMFDRDRYKCPTCGTYLASHMTVALVHYNIIILDDKTKFMIQNEIKETIKNHDENSHKDYTLEWDFVEKIFKKHGFPFNR